MIALEGEEGAAGTRDTRDTRAARLRRLKRLRRPATHEIGLKNNSLAGCTTASVASAAMEGRLRIILR